MYFALNRSTLQLSMLKLIKDGSIPFAGLRQLGRIFEPGYNDENQALNYKEALIRQL